MSVFFPWRGSRIIMGDREIPPTIVVMVASDDDTPPPPAYVFFPSIMKRRRSRKGLKVTVSSGDDLTIVFR
jgi:hypothetical protein